MLALDGAALAVIFLFSVHFERLRRLKHLRRTYRNVLVQLSGRLLLIHDDDALMATVTDTVQRHSEFGLCCAGRFDDAGERIETLRCGGDTADPGILNRMEGLQKFLESLRQKPFLSRGRSSGASVFAALDAEWIVPVRREGRLFGLLGMGRSAPAYKPDRDDLALFQSIANQMAVAFEKNEAIRRSNAMVRELTEAKVRERYLDTLEETNRALESKNAELRKLYDDLKQAETQLVHSEKMASLGRLVAGISHELNNPTAFIYQNMRQLQSYAGRIKAALEGPPSDASRVLGSLLPDIEGLIRDTVNGSQMVKILVDNLRRFSHADRAETRISDVHECIESALLILGSQLKDRIAVHKQYGVKSRIACNPGQLNQVFLNLVANASQAITGKGDVWITTSEQGGELCVEVRDNGKGIAAEHLGKIFDPFFTTKDVGEGTGLGLSIAYSIVKDHGGRIDADSDPGKGSAFTVRLPARPEADAAPDSEDAGRPGPNEP
jgi:two-component system NtrC family sensor kinase